MKTRDPHNRFSVFVRSSGAAVISALLLLVICLPAAGMDISKSAIRMREMINLALDTHQITRQEYDAIFRVALEDGVVDKHEQALIDLLQAYIEDKAIKFVLLRGL